MAFYLVLGIDNVFIAMPRICFTIYTSGESRSKGVDMKKAMLLSLFVAMFSGSAIASDYYEVSTHDCRHASMRAALDRATADRRAVVTVVKCEKSSLRGNEITARATAESSAPKITHCGCGHRYGRPVEEVVSRQYFVRETVQKYRPVVKYVPDGTYTRTRPVCGDIDCR